MRVKRFDLNGWVIVQMLKGERQSFRCTTPLPKDANILKIVASNYSPDMFHVFVLSEEFPAVDSGEPLEGSELEFETVSA